MRWLDVDGGRERERKGRRERGKGKERKGGSADGMGYDAIRDVRVRYCCIYGVRSTYV
jgi:hypothetical protein